jgi:hypothetical protein
MEQPETEVSEGVVSTRVNRIDPAAKPSTSGGYALSPTLPQPCPTCGIAQGTVAGPVVPTWVYALGRIEPRFPNLAVEKELAQATGREKTSGLTDRQALRAVLSKTENRYLARQLCWIMSVEGLETYILRPRDMRDFDLLVEALRADPSPADMDVVIGAMGPIASPDVCNGLMVPIVIFEQLYSFDRDSLIKSIPKPAKTTEKDFAPVAAELLDRIMQMADNAGAIADHRALNYLVVRYPGIYAAAADAFSRNASLTGVEVRPSPLGGVRTIVDVIFAFTNRSTDVVEKQFLRVDVTEMFPFLVTKLSPFFDR